MTTEERLKMVEMALKQAEVREEECRLNYLIAQNQVRTLRGEQNNGSDTGAGNKPPAGK
jgi:hypothetical protein